MKKLLNKVLTATIFATVTISSVSVIGISEVSAKTYKTYTSPSYEFWDSYRSKKGFYYWHYKKTLSSGIVIKNGGKYEGDAALMILKNNKKVYVDESYVYSGLDDHMRFASNSKGYLNMFYSTGDKQGNVGYQLLTVSPSGKVSKTSRKFFSGGVDKLTFVTPNKLKITKWNGKKIIYTFNKGNISQVLTK